MVLPENSVSALDGAAILIDNTHPEPNGPIQGNVEQRPRFTGDIRNEKGLCIQRAKEFQLGVSWETL